MLALRLGLLLGALPLAACSELYLSSLTNANDVANLTNPLLQCKELPSWGSPFGIALGSIASVGINIGQNMQADGIATLPQAQKSSPHKSRLWIIGLAVFISCSMVNFGALALAPASVLVPLESIQFVTNVIYRKVVSKTPVPYRMMLGVGLAVIGTVLTVVFGASGDPCHSLAHLEWAWTSYVWWIYCAITFSIGAAAIKINIDYTKKKKAHEAGGPPPPRNTEIILPVSFTLSSALFGGSQMIVQSKVFSELLGKIFAGEYKETLTSWLLYVSLVLVITCGMIWMIRMTKCLELYNPLIILPMMVATYILFGGVAGGIYFQEFNTLHEGMAGHAGWGLYVGGMCFVVAGLYFIATAGARQEEQMKQKRTSVVVQPGQAAANGAVSTFAPARPAGQSAGDEEGAGPAREGGLKARIAWGLVREATMSDKLATIAAMEENAARMPSFVPGYHPAVLVANSAVAMSFGVRKRVASVVAPRGADAFDSAGSSGVRPTARARGCSGSGDGATAPGDVLPTIAGSAKSGKSGKRNTVSQGTGRHRKGSVPEHTPDGLVGESGAQSMPSNSFLQNALQVGTRLQADEL